MIIPGFVVALLTFPGVIIHEAAHQLFCRLRGVAVFDVCYIRAGNPAGYVLHEPSGNFTTSFLITVGPFIVNSSLCLLLCLPAFFPVHEFDVKDPLSYLLIWLGVSIGMHAFPSPGDGKVLWAHAKVAAKEYNLLAILSFPLVVLIYVAYALSFFWFDAIYGMALGLALPRWLIDVLF